MQYVIVVFFFFFLFNDTATTEIYTLSLHDALPICLSEQLEHCLEMWEEYASQNESLSAQLSGLEETEIGRAHV